MLFDVRTKITNFYSQFSLSTVFTQNDNFDKLTSLFIRDRNGSDLKRIMHNPTPTQQEAGF